MDDKEIVQALEEYGLTNTEAKIYIELVKLGEGTAYKLSKQAGIYKANTYMAIDSLVKDNLVSKRSESGRTVFKAVQPEELLLNLERKKERLSLVLPYIKRSLQEEIEDVSVFSGVDSFFNFFYSLLEKKESIKVFDIPKYVPDIVINHIGKFHKERIKRNIKMYHIYDYDAKERIEMLKKMKYTYAKRGIKDRLSLTTTLVCGDTTALINWKKGVRVVKILDKDIADEFSAQFDILWNFK